MRTSDVAVLSGTAIGNYNLRLDKSVNNLHETFVIKLDTRGFKHDYQEIEIGVCNSSCLHQTKTYKSALNDTIQLNSFSSNLPDTYTLYLQNYSHMFELYECDACSQFLQYGLLNMDETPYTGSLYSIDSNYHVYVKTNQLISNQPIYLQAYFPGHCSFV